MSEVNAMSKVNEVNEVNAMGTMCPECGAQMELDGQMMAGEIVQCPECGVELEVIEVNPLTLDLAPEVEEDWGE